MSTPVQRLGVVLLVLVLLLSSVAPAAVGQEVGPNTTNRTATNESTDLSTYSPAELQNLSNEQIQSGLGNTTEADLSEAQKDVLNERIRSNQGFFSEFIDGMGTCAGAPISCALDNTRAAGEGIYELGGGSENLVPSGGDVAADVANWTKDRANETIRPVLGVAMEFVVGTPTPENEGWRGITGQPTNSSANASLAQGVWRTGYNEVYLDYSFLYAFVFLMMCTVALLGIFPWQGLLHSYAKYKVVSAIVLATLILTLWWPAGTFLLKISDAVAVSIAPSPTELTNSLGSILKSGSSILLLALAEVLFGMTEIALLALVYGLRWGLIIVGMFAMPLILVLALVGPHPRLRQLGSTLAWQFVGLLVMTWPVAFMMRLGYELQWEFSTSGLANFVLSLAMLAVGLVIPLVISISLLRAPPSITAIAAGATGAAAGLSLREDEDDYSTDDYDSDSSSGGRSNGDSGSGGDADSGPSPGIEPYAGPTPSERIAVVIAGTQASGPNQPHTVAAGAGTTDSPQRVTARDVIDVPQHNDGNDAVTAGDRLGQHPTTAAMDGTTRSHQGRDEMSPSDASTPANTGASGAETAPALPEPTYVPSSSEPPTGDDDAVTTAERKREQTRDGAASEEANTLEQRRRLHSGTDEPRDRTNATLGETDASSSNTSDAATDSSTSTAATDRTESDTSFTRTHDGPSTLSDKRWAALKRRYGDGVDDNSHGDTDTPEVPQDDRDGGQEGESQ